MSCFFPSNPTNALEGMEKDFFKTNFADNNQVMMDNNIVDAAPSKQIPNFDIEQNNSIIADSHSSGTVSNAHACSTGFHGVVSALLLDVKDNDPLWSYINDSNNTSTRRQLLSNSNQNTTANKIPPKEHHTALPKIKVQKSSIREDANTYTAYEEDESTYRDYPMFAAKINKAKASKNKITRYDATWNQGKEQQQTREELLDQMRYAVNKAGGGSTENIDERYLMIMETQSSTGDSESSGNQSEEIAPQWNGKDKYDFPSLHSA